MVIAGGAGRDVLLGLAGNDQNRRRHAVTGTRRRRRRRPAEVRPRSAGIGGTGQHYHMYSAPATVMTGSEDRGDTAVVIDVLAHRGLRHSRNPASLARRP
jgi:hypothetical protein